jgi:hypothetical protein
MDETGYEDVVAVSLQERGTWPKRFRADYEAPEIARYDKIEALRWAAGCAWQDQPILICLSAAGAVYALTHWVLGFFK